MSSNGCPKVVIFSGAGISTESGIRTFRDADGIWTKQFDLARVATIEAWEERPEDHYFPASLRAALAVFSKAFIPSSCGRQGTARSSM